MKRNAPFFRDIEKNHFNYLETEPKVIISFEGGAVVHIQGYTRKKYRAEFWDLSTNTLEYVAEIGHGCFASPSKKYYIKWDVRVYCEGKLVKSHIVDLKGKNVLVMLESTAIGDNLAWMPQVYRFSKLNECKLQLMTFQNSMYRESYPDIIWNNPGEKLQPYDYAYTIGYWYDENRVNRTPVDPRTVPLGKVPCDVLGIPYEETRPELSFVPSEKPPLDKPYVCIATQGTAGAKLWQRANGWQDVVDSLKFRSYEVAVIQKEPTDLKGIIDWTGPLDLKDRMNQLHHSVLFIGIGSGLSWLAWAVKKPVVLISGFSDAFAEFQMDCERIINRDVCNSCWNDTSFGFDKGDMMWCPRHKGTERHFECSKEISPDRVMRSVDKILNIKGVQVPS